MFLRLTMVMCFAAAKAFSTEPGTWSLRWQAPESCTDAGSIAAQVEQKVGRPVFAATARNKLGVIVRREREWSAQVTSTAADGSLVGMERLTSAQSDCGELEAKAVDALTQFVTAARGEAPAPSVVGEIVGAPERDAVLVHLEADKSSVRLMRVGATGYGYANGQAVSVTSTNVVCAAPCDMWVPKTSDSFFVAGEGVTPSPTFSLIEYRPAVALKATAGSLSTRVWGLFTTYFGVPLLIGGIAMGIGGAAINGSRSGTGVGSTLSLLGLGFGIVGAILTAIGIPLTVTSGTHVDFDNAAVPASPSREKVLEGASTI